MKKLLAVVLAVLVVGTLVACGGGKKEPEPQGSGSAAAPVGTVDIGLQAVYGPNGDQLWSAYDELIKKVKTTADTSERASYMYEAEEWVKNTWTILPFSSCCYPPFWPLPLPWPGICRTIWKTIRGNTAS